MNLTEADLRTLELKLTRHKINFAYNKNTRELIIGKSKNTSSKLFIGITGVVLSLASLFSLVFLNIPFGRVINYFLSGGIGAFGIKNLIIYYNLKENDDKKIISSNGITINNQFYSKNEILKTIYKIEYDESTNCTGYLEIITIKGRKKLITFTNDERQFLKSDLIFLKECITICLA